MIPLTDPCGKLELNRIYNMDCLDGMREIPDKCIDLVCTSPPYNCGKQYGEYSDDLSWDEYWNLTEKWLTESYRVLKSGARLAANLPWWMEKKPRRDVPYMFKSIALRIGFLYLDKIIWIKGNEQNVNVSGSGWGTYLSPSGASIRCATEPILIFAKERRGRGIISGEGRGACIRGDMTPKEWQDWTIDTWFIRGESNPDHPAVFPEEIPKRIIKLYTFPGEVVLDPFLGTGTTSLVCCENGRQFIGFEKEKVYFDKAQERIKKAQEQGKIGTWF